MAWSSTWLFIDSPDALSMFLRMLGVPGVDEKKLWSALRREAFPAMGKKLTEFNVTESHIIFTVEGKEKPIRVSSFRENEGVNVRMISR